MVHTVGITGIKGNVGEPTLKYLLEAAEQGKINLVVFSRSASQLEGVSGKKNVETRTLNYEDSAEDITKSVKGVNVFLYVWPLFAMQGY